MLIEVFSTSDLIKPSILLYTLYKPHKALKAVKVKVHFTSFLCRTRPQVLF